MRRLPGSHVPNVRNRSSKQNIWLTKLRPIMRCVSNEQLNDWSNRNVVGAHAEIKRRQEKRAKKEAQ
jgi:hypothetical protein